MGKLSEYLKMLEIATSLGELREQVTTLRDDNDRYKNALVALAAGAPDLVTRKMAADALGGMDVDQVVVTVDMDDIDLGGMDEPGSIQTVPPVEFLEDTVPLSAHLELVEQNARAMLDGIAENPENHGLAYNKLLQNGIRRIVGHGAAMQEKFDRGMRK